MYVPYLCSGVMSSSLTWHQFYCHFNIDTKFKVLYPLTGSTHLPTSSSLSGFIVSPTDTLGKTKSEVDTMSQIL